MAYFAIWAPKGEDSLSVVRCPTKESLYAWLTDGDDDFGYVGFHEFSTEDARDWGPEIVAGFDTGSILIIKGEDIQPTRKKVKVVEWWVD